MRTRVEDLGRISVLIDNILDLDVFELYSGRDKDFEDFFGSLEKEKKSDLLHKLIYGLSEVRNNLYIVSSVADGLDALNEEAEQSIKEMCCR